MSNKANTTEQEQAVTNATSETQTPAPVEPEEPDYKTLYEELLDSIERPHVSVKALKELAALVQEIRAQKASPTGRQAALVEAYEALR